MGHVMYCYTVRILDKASHIEETLSDFFVK